MRPGDEEQSSLPHCPPSLLQTTPSLPVSRVGADGFSADHRGQPAALAAAGIQLPLLEIDGGGEDAEQQLGAEERALVAAAAAAEAAADPALRGALLEGLSLFVSSALLAQQPGQEAPAGSDAELAQMLPLLRGRLQQRAEAAAAAAAELLRTRVAQVGADGEDAPMAAGGTEQQGVLVPTAQLTWGDEPASGQLPTSLPADLLRYPSCRALQLQLLALQDAQLSTAQLHLLASGSLLQLLAVQRPAPPHLKQATKQLRQLVASMASGGGSANVADAAAYQLLLWLLEVEPQQGSRGGDGGSEWQQLLQRSLVHEAWFRWQRALWSGAAAAMPAVHSGGVAPAVQQRWAAAAAGPLRLHIAAGTVLASAVAAAPATLIADRSARLLQLKLAARQLRAAATGCSSVSSQAAVAAAEWQAAAALAAATIVAQLPSVPDLQQRQQLEAAVAWLAGERCAGTAQAAAAQHAEQDTQLLQLASAALGSSSHPVLQELLQPVLLPALEALLQGSAAASSASPQGAGCLSRSCCISWLGLYSAFLHVPCLFQPRGWLIQPAPPLPLGSLCRGLARTRPRVVPACPGAPAPAGAAARRRPSGKVWTGAPACTGPAPLPSSARARSAAAGRNTAGRAQRGCGHSRAGGARGGAVGAGGAPAAAQHAPPRPTAIPGGELRRG